MSFYSVQQQHLKSGILQRLGKTTDADIARALRKETPDENDFLALLSEKAGEYLEDMAQRAHSLTIRNFGKVIQLYSPLYIGNFCDNECLYCGFKASNNISRKRLSPEELENEAKAIAGTGILHLLVLTGESRKYTPLSYIEESISVLKRYFSSISIEVYPLEKEEYDRLVALGIDGLTIYQETYDDLSYGKLHLKGSKRDYGFRLDTPERACRAGMRSVNIGPLLGLFDFRKDVFFAGLHAAYLQDRYPGTEISLSFPRIQPQQGNFTPDNPVADRDLVQAILATRLYLPRAGITISTRENSDFRKNLIGLGVTRMSAGSHTEVGGYTLAEKSCGQFDVADRSSVGNVKEMIISKGYQPVMKDWQALI